MSSAKKLPGKPAPVVDVPAGLPPEIGALWSTFAPGQRVRAACEIAYGSGKEVRKGWVGTVQAIGVCPVVVVLWDRWKELPFTHATIVSELEKEGGS